MTRTRPLAAAAIAAALLLSACSSDDDGGGSESTTTTEAAEETTTISIGLLPIAASGAVVVGIEQGFFADNGLEVELVTGQGGAAMLPAVSTGEMNFSVGNPVSVLIAQTQGLDVPIVSGFSHGATEGHDANAIIVPEGSDITSTLDLQGHSIAVNTLNQAGDMNAREAVLVAGGDPDTLSFIEIPFPDMPAQLARGTVDAIWVTEPFMSLLVSEGDQIASFSYQEALPGQPTMVAFTSGAFAEQNPEVIAAFRAALDQTLSYVQENPEALREVLPDFIDLDEEIANTMVIDQFSAEPPIEGLTGLAEMMLRHGVTATEPDVSTAVLD